MTELEAKLDSMTDQTYDEELVDAYLEALDEKAPLPKPVSYTHLDVYKRQPYHSHLRRGYGKKINSSITNYIFSIL